MARPSPRTGTTGAGIQKFGTQQLKYLDPQIPALGVIEKDVGARTRLFYGGEATIPKTPFSATYQQQRPNTIRTIAQLEISPHAQPEWEGFGFPDLGSLFPPASPNGNGTGCECEACKKGTGECSDKKPCCDAWDIGCELFGCKDKHGCECEACKNGTGQCSDKCAKCDAWDIGCEATCVITDPIGSWWEKYKNYVYIIGGLIGLGILLWLLRPLFGIGKNITGISKSAVTRVNGMR